MHDELQDGKSDFHKKVEQTNSCLRCTNSNLALVGGLVGGLGGGPAGAAAGDLVAL